MIQPVIRFSAHLPLLLAAALLIVVSVYLMARLGPVFNTPDETSNYISAKNFAEHGTLYIQDELTAVDAEDMLHPRGFINRNGRAVPMQFLGEPFCWGTAMKALGPGAWRVLAPALAIFFVVYIYAAFRFLAPGAPRVTFLFLFSAVPVVYLLGRPFLSVSLAIVFMAPAAFHALRYCRNRVTRDLVLMSVFLSLSLAARPDNLLAAAAGAYLVIGCARQGFFSRPILRDGLVVLAVVLLVFVLPTLVLNQLTYGDPLTYGYRIVDEVYGLRQMPAGEAATPPGVWRQARNLVFPFEFSVTVAARGLLKYLVFLAPLLTLAALAGVFALPAAFRSPCRRHLLGAVLVSAYLMISRSAAEVYGASRITPDIVDSIARYWVPVYILLLLLAWRNLGRLKIRALHYAAAVLAVGLGAYGIFWQWEQSLVNLAGIVEEKSEYWAPFLAHTEPDTVVYIGLQDKYVAPHRTVATWWTTPTVSYRDPQKIARSAARVIRLGRTVHVADVWKFKAPLEQALAGEGLTLFAGGYSPLFPRIVEAGEGKKRPLPLPVEITGRPGRSERSGSSGRSGRADRAGRR